MNLCGPSSLREDRIGRHAINREQAERVQAVGLVALDPYRWKLLACRFPTAPFRHELPSGVLIHRDDRRRPRQLGEGNIFTTLKDGFYKLNIVNSNIHAGSTLAGTPMASNVTQSFWTMYASFAPDNRSNPATPGDGNSIISVNSSVIDFANTNGFGYGTSLTGPSGQAYDANFDWNLDGDVGDDLIEFAKRFGAEWAF